MGLRARFRSFVNQDELNFLLTNRIPRHAATRFMGWFSKIEAPPVRAVSIALWKWFCDVDLADAKAGRFRSLHDAFVRELRPGARKVDPSPHVVSSPCDAIVGAHGEIRDGLAFQIKGLHYAIADLLGSEAEAAEFQQGNFVTLRLTAGMYHRFHAPHDLSVEQVRYIAGDTWNVNPPTLKRIERLYCRNERAPITVRLERDQTRLVLVPVAAILVASIRLPWFEPNSSIRARGARATRPSPRPFFTKGEEMGWFEHGSTILVLAPPQCRPLETLEEGRRVQMGEALMRLDERHAATP